MNSNCLIGSTGFVGRNLQRQALFHDHYNSANSGDMRGKQYNVAVCCGVSAMKWKANADPEADWRSIQLLLDNLEQVQVNEIVLISTVDVFASPVLVDEASDPHASTNHAYGTNRLKVEDFVRVRFKNVLILRLPGLFGRGLKKNVIYDLCHDNNLQSIHPDGSFQYYDLSRLWNDIQTARRSNLQLLHVATEPIATRVIADNFFPGKQIGDSAARPANYDMRTQHADLYRGSGGYLYSAGQVLDDLGRYLNSEQESTAA